ncbi:MAG: hypothetical protein V3T86_09625 [Planctomycetota bacterium]
MCTTAGLCLRSSARKRHMKLTELPGALFHLDDRRALGQEPHRIAGLRQTHEPVLDIRGSVAHERRHTFFQPAGAKRVEHVDDADHRDSDRRSWANSA